jgi:NADH-quinone oxidoreductase subunit M
MAGGILGAFASLNLFFLYFLHELALIPTFIMIGVWGHGPRKNYATFQITIYLGIGALLALVGLIALYVQAGINTFDIPALTDHFLHKPMSMGSQFWIFPLLMFGFGILVSLWPFHSWAPLGYACAPTATAMMHAGVIKKFGLYGLIRVAPMLPIGLDHWGETMALLALGNLLYCGLVAIRQKDLNLLVGNASVAHMGFVFLGIACLGFGDPACSGGPATSCNSLREVALTGAVMVMIAHGLLAALTFGLTGYLRQQTGTLEMAQLGGLLKRLPFIGAALAMALFAGCGLPGFANFIGEVMVFFGTWKLMPEIVSVAAWAALIIGAVYMMRAIRNVLHGPPRDAWNGVADASTWRKIPFVLLLAALLLFGCLPGLLTGKIQSNTGSIVTGSKGKTARMMLQFMSNDDTNAPASTPSISPSR